MTHSSRGYIEDIFVQLASSKIVQKLANVVVSSNSKDLDYNTQLQKLCSKNNFSFIAQTNGSAAEHLATIYKSCPTDLCIMLHDDDHIYINQFDKYLLSVMKNPGFGSYSCNDTIIINRKKKTNSVDQSELRVLDNFSASIAYLCNRHLVSFPTIIYNRSMLSVEFDDQRFGKHTDAYLVIGLIRKRHLFIGHSAIGYRIHNEQDSAKKDNIKYLLKFYLFFVLIGNLASFNFKGMKFIWRRIRYLYND